LVQMANQHSAETIITTEKDGVRLRELQLWTKQVWELRIRATIVVQEAAWETCILNAVKA
jgi:tetraacyldisaccharide-1-P 4'-kinase